MLAAICGRLAAYVSLTKPRLVLLVLVTVAVGFLLGPRGSGSHATLSSLVATLVGTALVAGGAARSTSGWSGIAMPGCGGRPTAPSRRPPGSVGSRGLRRSARPGGNGGLARGGKPRWRPRSRS